MYIYASNLNLLEKLQIEHIYDDNKYADSEHIFDGDEGTQTGSKPQLTIADNILQAMLTCEEQEKIGTHNNSFNSNVVTDTELLKCGVFISTDRKNSS